MGQNQTNFNEFLKFGEEGEEIVAEYLMNNCGISILPLYQFEAESTPIILNKKIKMITPDLTCFNSGHVFFVEVKRKRKWVRRKGQLETGFNYDHFIHYSRVEKDTGLKVFIVFNHEKENPTGLYYVELKNYDRIWDGTNSVGQKTYPPICFYKYQSLKPLDKYSIHIPQENNESNMSKMHLDT